MKRFVAGLIAGVMIMAGSPVLAGTAKNVEVTLGQMKLVVNGNEIEDELLNYKDATYVQLRAIAEALGLEINYDDENRTVHLDSIAETSTGQQDSAWTDTIIFDDLEISLGTCPEFIIFENKYNEKNGAEIIKIPIKIKNLNRDSHGLNIFYYYYYRPEGTKAENFDIYYDDSVFTAGKIRSGGELETYVYVEYTGDGDYCMEFSNFFNKEELIVRVEK